MKFTLAIATLAAVAVALPAQVRQPNPDAEAKHAPVAAAFTTLGGYLKVAAEEGMPNAYQNEIDAGEANSKEILGE